MHFWHKVQVLTSQTTQAQLSKLGQLRPKVYLIGLFKRSVDGLLTATFAIFVRQLMFSQTFQTIDMRYTHTHTFSVHGDHTHFRSVIVEAIAPV